MLFNCIKGLFHLPSCLPHSGNSNCFQDNLGDCAEIAYIATREPSFIFLVKGQHTEVRSLDCRPEHSRVGEFAWLSTKLSSPLCLWPSLHSQALCLNPILSFCGLPLISPKVSADNLRCDHTPRSIAFQKRPPR